MQAQNNQSSKRYFKKISLKKTDQVFDNDFKGFEIDLKGTKLRYNVDKPDQLKKHQSDLNNFIGEFLGDDGTVTDAYAYHKAIFMARNGDKVAELFYEQGRADAIKEATKESNNISMTPKEGTPSARENELAPGQFKEVEFQPKSGVRMTPLRFGNK